MLKVANNMHLFLIFIYINIIHKNVVLLFLFYFIQNVFFPQKISTWNENFCLLQ